MNDEYPALTGEVVKERHARICRERGHATHTVDGVDSGSCPRCGDVTLQAEGGAPSGRPELIQPQRVSPPAISSDAGAPSDQGMTRDETIAAFQAVHTWCTDPNDPGELYDLHAADGVPWCGECADWHHPDEGHSQP